MSDKKSIDILYKTISEIKFEYITTEKTKKKIKIDTNNGEKHVHIIDLIYKKPNKEKQLLLIIIPKQKLIELNDTNNYLKIEINGEIEKKIKELESHIKDLIYENSSIIFNGKNFSKEKINNGLISNIKIKKKDNTYIKYISLTIDKNTKFFKIDKTGIIKIISDIENKNNTKTDNIVCKCIIRIENLQFIDNIFTYNLVVDTCEIEKYSNYSYIIKNGELERGEIDSEESDKLDDEYWDSASI